MAEVSGNGIVVEYICRITDETDGGEPTPQDTQSAQNNLTGKTSATKKSPKKKAKNALSAKTTANSVLQIALPALNAATGGMAGKAIGAAKQAFSLLDAAATGSVGGVVGVTASMGAWLVGEIVGYIQTRRKQNEALAESLDQTNFMRMAAGLDSIEYTQSGLTKKVQFQNNR